MWDFLNWLDNWQGIEYISCGVVGLVFLGLIWLWGCSVGRKFYDNLIWMAREILHDKYLTDSGKITRLHKLFKEEDKDD